MCVCVWSLVCNGQLSMWWLCFILLIFGGFQEGVLSFRSADSPCGLTCVMQWSQCFWQQKSQPSHTQELNLLVMKMHISGHILEVVTSPLVPVLLGCAELTAGNWMACTLSSNLAGILDWVPGPCLLIWQGYQTEYLVLVFWFGRDTRLSVWSFGWGWAAWASGHITADPWAVWSCWRAGKFPQPPLQS